MLTTACGDKNVIKIDNPSYYIKYNTNSTSFMFAINGFVLKEEWGGDKNNYDEPINHLIRNGQNTIQLVTATEEDVKEYLDENFSLTIEVRVKGTVKDQAVDYLVTNMVYSPNFTDDITDLHKNSAPAGSFAFGEDNMLTNGNGFNVSDITQGGTYYVGTGPSFERTFEAIVDFPEWAFFQGDKIISLPWYTEKEAIEYMALIQKEIDKAVAIFDTRNIDQILPMFEMRSKEIDQAFYKELGTTQDEIRYSLDVVLNERNLPQGFVSDDSFQFVTSLDGRLLSRVDAGNMAGTIFFDDEETGTSTSYTIYWMRKNGEWIIAR